MSTSPDPGSDSIGVTWDVATLFPRQGQWSETEYLNLTDDLTQLVELTDGRLEILELPTTSHQRVVFNLVRQLADFVQQQALGTALMAPLRVQLRPGMFREPDVVFVLNEHAHFVQDDFWTGADLVMEVVSSGAKSRRRDLQEKRREYAEAGIAEYWIVDPLAEAILVLELINASYQVVAESGKNEIARSRLLDGFAISVNEVLGLSTQHGDATD